MTGFHAASEFAHDPRHNGTAFREPTWEELGIPDPFTPEVLADLRATIRAGAAREVVFLVGLYARKHPTRSPAATTGPETAPMGGLHLYSFVDVLNTEHGMRRDDALVYMQQLVADVATGLGLGIDQLYSSPEWIKPTPARAMTQALNIDRLLQPGAIHLDHFVEAVRANRGGERVTAKAAVLAAIETIAGEVGGRRALYDRPGAVAKEHTGRLCELLGITAPAPTRGPIDLERPS